MLVQPDSDSTAVAAAKTLNLIRCVISIVLPFRLLALPIQAVNAVSAWGQHMSFFRYPPLRPCKPAVKQVGPAQHRAFGS